MNLYRILRKENYETWILNREKNNYVERIVILFKEDLTYIYIITQDELILEDETLIEELQNLYHHHMDYCSENVEVVLISKKHKILIDEEKEIDIIAEKTNEIIEKLSK